MTKWSARRPSIAERGDVAPRAARAFEGRPGVVHLDVPESILNGTYELDPSWLRAPSVTYRATTPLSRRREQVREVARWLDEAKRPLDPRGLRRAARRADDELAELAALLEAPVTTSWGARGAIDERDPTRDLDDLRRTR
jgi:acetolactate synthase-1/2/3 large subunit